MTYKSELTIANGQIACHRNARFIGYGLKKGKALGTLANVDQTQIIEMPVAENLMMGFATGLSLTGFMPVVFIERMDFLLNAADAIVNHLDKIQELSAGEFSPAVIIRCIVGNKNKPLYTGATHTQDFSEAFRNMVSFDILKLTDETHIKHGYEKAMNNFLAGKSTMLIEYKDLV